MYYIAILTSLQFCFIALIKCTFYTFYNYTAYTCLKKAFFTKESVPNDDHTT